MRLCSVEGCGKKHHGLGFCEKHYRRVLRYGSTQLPIKVKEPKICEVEGCNKPHVAKGYCSTHYKQHQKGILSKRNQRTSNEIVVEGDIAKIALYNRYCEIIAYALIDVEDVDKIKHMKWGSTGRGYTTCYSPKVFLHRYLLDAPEDKSVDHINGHPLDNRKQNLRLASHQENLCNRTSLSSNNTSGVTGVYWRSDRNKWVAQIAVNYKNINLGSFHSFEDAVAVRRQAEKDYFGDFAPKGDYT